MGADVAASSPEERSTNARIAAHSLHAQRDGRELTQVARDRFLARFEEQVDPDRQLDPEERRKRAEHARTAYFTKLGKASGAARRRR